MKNQNQPTPEQLEALEQIEQILNSVGLELIGTRPKDR